MYVNVKPYCERCPEFTPKVVRYYADKEIFTQQIHCEHEKICENFVEYLRKRLEEEKT